MEVFFYGVNEDAKVSAHKFVFLKIYHSHIIFYNSRKNVYLHTDCREQVQSAKAHFANPQTKTGHFVFLDEYGILMLV